MTDFSRGLLCVFAIASFVLSNPLWAGEVGYGQDEETFDPGNVRREDYPFQQTALECGKDVQTKTNVKYGKRTMCGEAVRNMLQCMSSVTGTYRQCEGRCGNGKDFVDCKNGAMEKCGYKKYPPDSKECRLPGAVLAYKTSPTSRGKIWGHVEFVCGIKDYCSVYGDKKHDEQWPRDPADACWYPAMGPQSGRG